VAEHSPTPLVTAADLAALLEDISAAQTDLAANEDVSARVREVIRSLPGRLHADASWRALPGDPYLAEQAFAGTSRAVAALLEDDVVERRRGARLGLEQVRQALRDIADSKAADDEASAEQLVIWLDEVLGPASARLARLIGVTPTTWQRWSAGRQQPDDVANLRLRRAARLVGQLRHTLTAPGVLAWFDRPHPLIKDGAGTPAELLDDADGYRVLVSLAAGLRSMQAT